MNKAASNVQDTDGNAHTTLLRSINPVAQCSFLKREEKLVWQNQQESSML
jgi:hypothetical protein